MLPNKNAFNLNANLTNTFLKTSIASFCKLKNNASINYWVFQSEKILLYL